MKVFHGALFEVVEVIDVILDQWVKNYDFRSEKLFYQQFNSTLLFQRYHFKAVSPIKGWIQEFSESLFPIDDLFFSSAHEKIHALLLWKASCFSLHISKRVDNRNKLFRLELSKYVVKNQYVE